MEKGSKELARQIGLKLNQAREEAGLSRAEMGKALGLSEQGYGHIEAGRAMLSIEYLLELPRILGKPIIYFLPDSAVSEAELQGLTLDPLFQEVVEAWPKLDQVAKGTIVELLELVVERQEEKAAEETES